ncbi:MAG: helix-turn-helix transcriptional regulator [Clostridiales Family XIII bacterium]|jgi:LuxR family transcriptional regulator of spore coat protein|nr:helix-turn-helix transcriptional regulator [Clostridiales Family XIII bacterium]
MNYLRNLWKSRDELSVGNIRKAYVPYMLVFPLGIMLSDVLYHDWETEIFGVDSILLQILVYGFAWLLCTFLPKNSIPYALRTALIAGAALVVPTVLLANSGATGLILIAAFQFCIGVTAACGFFIFSYVLRNAERWMATVIIGLYYGIAWGLYEVGSVKEFTITVLPIILVVVFVIVIFFIKPDTLKNAAVSASAWKRAKTDRGESSVENTSTGQTKKGFYYVFILYVVYYFINLTNYFLEYEQDYIDDTFYGIGMIFGVLFVILIQLIFNRSVWHLWNLYLSLTVIGVVITGLGFVLDAKTGSFIYGVADNIGYLAVLYLIGSVAKMDGRYRFYRWACFIMFAHDVILSPVMDQVFEIAPDADNVIAVSIILVSVVVCFLLAPLLNKTIFSAEWIDNLHALDLMQFGVQMTEVDEIDRTKNLGLTPREKQIFTLLLTEFSAKQIAGELKISSATINFHTTNLYRKLGIQSRTELFAKYVGKQ